MNTPYAIVIQASSVLEGHRHRDGDVFHAGILDPDASLRRFLTDFEARGSDTVTVTSWRLVTTAEAKYDPLICPYTSGGRAVAA
jgi:hypothetical protein